MVEITTGPVINLLRNKTDMQEADQTIDLEKQQIKHVFFDMDDTLLETAPWHEKAVLEYCKSKGININDEKELKKLRSFLGVSHQHFYDRLIENKYDVPKDGFDEFFKFTANYVTDKIKAGEVDFREDIKEVLKYLAYNGIKLHIVSNSPNVIVQAAKNHIEKEAGVKFESTTAVDDPSMEAKPSPTMYDHAIKKSGAKPEECIILEDSRTGMKAGMASRGGAEEENGPLVVIWQTEENKEKLAEAAREYSYCLGKKRLILHLGKLMTLFKGTGGQKLAPTGQWRTGFGSFIL